MMMGTLAINGRGVVKNPRLVFQVSESLRHGASQECATALDGVTCKRIRGAGVPGAGVAYLSRIQHGDAGNPLYRLASIFVMGRLLGVPKSRFQRLIDWLQSALDRAYGDTPVPSVKEALEADSAIDPSDDHLRFQAALGCPDATVALLDIKRRQLAHLPTVILALEAGQ